MKTAKNLPNFFGIFYYFKNMPKPIQKCQKSAKFGWQFLFWKKCAKHLKKCQISRIWQKKRQSGNPAADDLGYGSGTNFVRHSVCRPSKPGDIRYY